MIIVAIVVLAVFLVAVLAAVIVEVVVVVVLRLAAIVIMTVFLVTRGMAQVAYPLPVLVADGSMMHVEATIVEFFICTRQEHVIPQVARLLMV